MNVRWFASVLIVFSAFVFHANAAKWSSCDSQGGYSQAGYDMHNDIWQERAGEQCLWVNSEKNWGVWASYAKTRGVKSFPHTSVDRNIDVSSLHSCRSSFIVDVPEEGDYVVKYDLLYDNDSFQVMLWMNYNGDVAPVSYSYNDQGMPIPEVYHLHLGGHTWNVYRGTNGANELYSFVRVQKVASGKVDIMAISKWLKKEGWFGNANLQKIRFGFEITSAPEAAGADFMVSDYSLSCP